MKPQLIKVFVAFLFLTMSFPGITQLTLPCGKGRIDTQALNIVREYERSHQRTALVNNLTRVYFHVFHNDGGGMVKLEPVLKHRRRVMDGC